MILMFHDDDCGVLLDSTGLCPKCHFHPDLQSTSFREVPNEELDALREIGRKDFLGIMRTPVHR